MIVSLVSIFEFGYNAYLSQVTLGYDNVNKFSDATVSVKRVTDNIQENSDQKFYRIASDFGYSRTVPSLISYPGLVRLVRVWNEAPWTTLLLWEILESMRQPSIQMEPH